jgi:hypothetical protein
LLSNPIYTGQIVHKGELYPGLHPALIDDETWTAVRNQLAANTNDHRRKAKAAERMKATLARLGIRSFKPTLRKAADRLATLHTPEGMPLPPNVLAELQRDMARLGFVVSQIREIEEARQKRLEQEPETEPHAMVRHLVRVVGVGVETADMLVNEVLSRPMRDRKAVARGACPRAGEGRTRGPV